MSAVQYKRCFPFHAAKSGRLSDRCDEFAEGQLMHPGLGKGRFAPTGCRHPKAMFALQRISTIAVRPAADEHDIEPVFQHPRHAVPVDRVHPDDEIGTRQGGLLGSHIDIEIGIQIVELAYLQVGEVVHCFKQSTAGAGALGVGMGVNYQDHRRSISHNFTELAFLHPTS